MLLLIIISSLNINGLLSEPAQPKTGDYLNSSTTVPAFPVQTEPQTCRLDLSAELFGGVNAACGRKLDRSRCCPVLAAWLFAAHATSALQLTHTPPSTITNDMPMIPDDSEKCVDSLQDSLQSRNIHIPQPNASCDAVLCFCGIRLHQLTSLSCPAAFNITENHINATPSAAVRNLEHNCRNSSNAGCSKCIGALQKLKGDGESGRKEIEREKDDRASKMLNRDCQLMGLTWLLSRNKTAYIPTVSAVLRAIMYSTDESKCSLDQENMPLAVDSLQLEKYDSSSSSLSTLWLSQFLTFSIHIFLLIFLV
ncbi:unnamed protein product [Fraxinus pennsylvanica]|uniref:SPARK domain-containing protein n=1 Tax=Fraxinus pennsylvanica TaxID=56036 RepID=A0AAD1Z0D1_9LAMI|nr:unnamed protein product [Fraxinus pennsylvanica]